MAVGIAFGELGALLRSAAILALAIAATVGLAAGFALILPELMPLSDNGQVTGRVSPTLVDLVAAALTGLAGSFAISRRDVGDILPGVAIAISLVPPLAVVGVTAVAGDWDGALGAMLLFLTNMLAIVVVGAVLFSGLRIRKGRLETHARRRVYVVIAVASVVVVAALSASTYRTVESTRWQEAAVRVGSAWAAGRGERLVSASFEGEDLVVVVEGRGTDEGNGDLVRRLAGAVPDGTPVIVSRIVGDRSEAGDVGDQQRAP